MRLKVAASIFVYIFVFGAIVGCAPKIYVIDRQSVFEQESAGEWPQFESELTKKSIATGPEPFAQVPLSQKKARLFKVLNGELVAQPEKSGVKKADKK